MLSLSDLDAARFWKKVKKTETCWYWTAFSNGVAAQFWLNGRMENATTVLLALLGVHRPDGKIVRRLCETPHCMNPLHLVFAEPGDWIKDTPPPWQKLSEREIAEIKNSNLPAEELASKYGVHYTHVYRIKRS